jgi:hypothetical protein
MVENRNGFNFDSPEIGQAGALYRASRIGGKTGDVKTD